MLIVTKKVPHTTQSDLIGVGLYSIPDAARIIKVGEAVLRRWVADYTNTSRDLDDHHEPVVHRRLNDHGGVLTFLELIELFVVKQFRDAGVSMQVIRKTAQVAAQRFDTPYPFATGDFDTDGRSILHAMEDSRDGSTSAEDLARGQYAFDSLMHPFFKRLDYRDHAEALRYWPLGRDGRVVLDPQRHFGAPIDARTGVPTRTLFAAVTAGVGQLLDVVADWFEVPLTAVQAAVDYEALLATT